MFTRLALNGSRSKRAASSPIPPSKQDVDLAALNARYVSASSASRTSRSESRRLYGSRRAGSSKRSPPLIPRPLDQSSPPVTTSAGRSTFTMPAPGRSLHILLPYHRTVWPAEPAVTSVPRGRRMTSGGSRRHHDPSPFPNGAASPCCPLCVAPFSFCVVDALHLAPV